MANPPGRPARSLKARAIQWLALREHSRVELRRKLLPHAIAEMDAMQAGSLEGQAVEVGAAAVDATGSPRRAASSSRGTRPGSPSIGRGAALVGSSAADFVGCGSDGGTALEALDDASAAARTDAGFDADPTSAIAAIASARLRSGAGSAAVAGEPARSDACATRVGAAPLLAAAARPGNRDTFPSAADKVEALLDWLVAKGYLSDERFIESRVQARSARFGNLRIRRELQEHRLALPAAAVERLQASEMSRARALYDRRFDGPPADAAERARRARFMSGRGFSFDVIGRLLGGRPGDDAGA